jgi:hypothetical protein
LTFWNTPLKIPGESAYYGKNEDSVIRKQKHNREIRNKEEHGNDGTEQ